MKYLWLLVALALGACGDEPGANGTSNSGDNAQTVMLGDIIDYSCAEPEWQPGICAAGKVTNHESQGAAHIALPTTIEYSEGPPSSGAHRGQWAKWGEYEYLPPQRWVHNLEHGGVAFLYNPCADAALVDELRQFARSRPEDDGGPFRWIMTPYPGLPTAVAAVAWTWTYEAECVDVADMDLFVANQYRRAPEDIGSDGSYDELWIGE